MFGNELLNSGVVLLKTWIAMVFLSIAVFPVTMSIFHKWKDKGYLFGKVLGLFFAGYLMWFLSSLKVLKFTLINSLLCLLLVALFCWGGFFLIYKKEGLYNVKQIWKQNKGVFIKRELLLLGFMAFFVYMIGNRMLGSSTEKPMDYAFMVNLSMTEYFPPIDTWASGTLLNYYYFGQYIFSYLSRISMVPIAYGYHMAMAVVASFCFCLVYSLVNQMLSAKKEGKLPVIGGILSAVMVTFGGNFHYVWYGMSVPFLQKFFPAIEGYDNYWFPNSTRYIGYFPNVEGDKTISEFPAYSFLIGDLHAHVINMLVVLCILAVLYTWYLTEEKSVKVMKQQPGYMDAVLQPKLWLLAFFLGISSMSNYWDMPIYYVVCGSVILVGNCIGKKGGSLFRPVGMTLFQGVCIYAVAMLVSMPFSVHFKEMITGIAFCKTHSMLWQWLLLWGIFSGVILIFGLYLLWNKEVGKKADMVILLWGLCAIGLALLPEIVYVRDIYEEGYPRANTMFKLTYQAFILFAITFGYCVTVFLQNRKKSFKLTGMFGAGLVLLCATYYFSAASDWYGEYYKPSNYVGINAEKYYETVIPQDMEGINWLRDNIEGDRPVVLEADGLSYTDYQRVSILTGFPTVLGWHTHEWLWKNGYSIVADRSTDIKEIYTTNDKERLQELLKKYDIEYVFVGTKEWEKYGDVNLTLLEEIGNVVYESSNSNVYIIVINP